MKKMTRPKTDAWATSVFTRKKTRGVQRMQSSVHQTARRTEMLHRSQGRMVSERIPVAYFRL